MHRPFARETEPPVARSWHGLALVAGLSTAAMALWVAVALRRVVTRSLVLRERERRFVRKRPFGTARVLVVGDSAGVGLGATTPACTIAGRLAAAHPDWSIGNLSRSGSRTADVAALLGRLHRRLGSLGVPPAPYRALIIHTGGNDAIRLTSRSALEHSFSRALAAAALLASQPVVVTGGNLALAPAFPPPLSWLFGWRSRRVRRLFDEMTRHRHVTFVDLYRRRSEDPTVADPLRYFAADGLHPSDANYAIWFAEIDAALKNDRSTSREGSAAPKLQS
jgi:lysophospholipase L1-like esterase